MASVGRVWEIYEIRKESLALSKHFYVTWPSVSGVRVINARPHHAFCRVRILLYILWRHLLLGPFYWSRFVALGRLVAERLKLHGCGWKSKFLILSSTSADILEFRKILRVDFVTIVYVANSMAEWATMSHSAYRFMNHIKSFFRLVYHDIINFLESDRKNSIVFWENKIIFN